MLGFVADNANSADDMYEQPNIWNTWREKSGPMLSQGYNYRVAPRYDSNKSIIAAPGLSLSFTRHQTGPIHIK